MRYGTTVGVVSLVLALVPGVARAGGGEHCTVGDVMAAFNTWGGAMRVLIGSNSPSAVEDGRSLCSYRTFAALGPSEFTPGDDPLDPGTVEYTTPICYCEQDHILAGMTLRFQSHEAAVESHETYVPTVTWARELPNGEEVDAEPLTLGQTAIKVWLAAGFVVWYQIGAILPPTTAGSYTSTLSDDSGDPAVKIHVNVLPHASAHDHGSARDVLDGSVVCPP